MDLILEKFNLVWFRFINDLAGNNIWLDGFMIFAADKMGYVLIGSVFILFWRKDYFKKLVFVSLGSAIIARFIFVALIRHFLYSPRPFLVLENVNRLMNHSTESSFPSGHTTFYFALATGVYLYNNRAKPSSGLYGHKKAGWVYFVLAGLMGFARIFVSVHWPLDILAGAVLGILTAYLVERLTRRFRSLN